MLICIGDGIRDSLIMAVKSVASAVQNPTVTNKLASGPETRNIVNGIMMAARFITLQNLGVPPIFQLMYQMQSNGTTTRLIYPIMYAIIVLMCLLCLLLS